MSLESTEDKETPFHTFKFDEVTIHFINIGNAIESQILTEDNLINSSIISNELLNDDIVWEYEVINTPERTFSYFWGTYSGDIDNITLDMDYDTHILSIPLREYEVEKSNYLFYLPFSI